MVRTVVVSASVTLHAAAFTVLFVAALWRTEKIPLESPVSFRQPFVLPSAAPPGGTPKKVELTPAIVKERPKDTVQPTPPDKTPTQAVAETVAATTPGTGTDGPGGDGTNPDPNAPVDSTGTCTGEACGTDTTTGPPVEKKKKVVKTPVTVTPTIATALRTSGNEKIHAPNSVRVQMRRAGKDRLTGHFHVCISARGDVTSVRALKSTGYDEYDDEIVASMRAWRYRPYSINGEAYPFCYAVMIVYVMK